MTANTVNGGENGARSGAQTLVLLAVPLNVPILRALAERPKQQLELRQETGSPAQTTLRAQLKRLNEIAAIEKHRRNRFPGVLEYELSAAGRDLLFVADTVERWLERASEGPLPLGGSAAKAAVKAFAGGWSTTMLRALAASPLSLTELDRVIPSLSYPSLSYPSLERRLAALRLAGQVEAQESNGRGTPYAVSAWTREGVGPLTAAARWERRHMPRNSSPIGRIDAEAVFLLAVPLLSLSEDVSGSSAWPWSFRAAKGPGSPASSWRLRKAGSLRAPRAYRARPTPGRWARRQHGSRRWSAPTPTASSPATTVASPASCSSPCTEPCSAPSDRFAPEIRQ